MAERPAILRVLRALDAAALAACALALAAGPASAATPELVAGGATDPSAADGLLAYHEPGTTGVLRRPGEALRLRGAFPAVGGGLVAWVEEDRIAVARADTLQITSSYLAPGAEALAVSASRLVWRGNDRLFTIAFADPAATIKRVAAGGVGRPALDGDLLAFHQATPRRSSLREVDLATGARRTVRSARGALLLNPSPLAGATLYVRSTRNRQQLRLRNPDGKERVLFATTPTARRDLGRERGRGRHKHGRRPPPQPSRPPRGTTDTLWTTALTPSDAYVTRLRARKGGGAAAVLLRVPR